MFQSLIITLAALTVVITGCQKTNVKSAPVQQPPVRAAGQPPVYPPGTPLPPGQPPVRPPVPPPGLPPVVPPGYPPQPPVYPPVYPPQPPGLPPGVPPGYPPPPPPPTEPPYYPPTVNPPGYPPGQPPGYPPGQPPGQPPGFPPQPPVEPPYYPPTVNPPINPIVPGTPVNPPQQPPVVPTLLPPSTVPATTIVPLPQQPFITPTSGTQVFVPPPPPAPAPMPIAQKPMLQPQQQAANVPMPRPLPVARENGFAGGQPKVQTASGAPECGEGGEACKPMQAIDGKCSEKPLKIIPKTEQKKLDVLFVIDTSLSMRKPTKDSPKGELAQIASQMGKYVDVFRNDNVDINIAVMLAHGPDSKNYHGRLFKSSKGDPAVLKTRELDKNRLVRLLEDKMKSAPNDSSDAQGEALLLSLYTSVNDAKRRNEIIAQDFYRKDASLAVIMVTDEQDVCFDYNSKVDPDTGAAYQPTMKQYTVPGKLVKNAKGKKVREASETKMEEDKHEKRFRENVCAKAVKKGKEVGPLTPGNVHEALLALKQTSDKLMLSGIVYTSKATTPAAGREDENEMGHGVIELVSIDDNGLIPLNDAGTGTERFSKGLTSLAQSVKADMTTSSDIACTTVGIHPEAIDLSTVNVEILDDSGKVIATYAPGHNSASIMTNGKGKRPYMQSSVDGKDLSKKLTEENITNAKTNITFKTRIDRDVKTGEEVDPATGLKKKK